MRNGQNKRMRGRGRKGHNPLTRVYESNGPDVKIRGTANHVAEKYIQLARDAQGSGDPVAAENYYQHAEHYFRLIAAAQDQFRQGQPSFYQQQQNEYQQQQNESREDAYDDGDEDVQPAMGAEPGFVQREQFHQREQPYPTREPQPAMVQPREGAPHVNNPQAGGSPRPVGAQELDRLPSFITGGGQPPQPQNLGPNGHDNQGDRYTHRRRRRHRSSGPRSDMAGGPQQAAGDGGEDAGPGVPQPSGE
jgi:hypothetical protein